MNELTSDQRKLYDFIIEYKRRSNGNSPSYREMMKHMGHSSTGQIYALLRALTQQGLIVQLTGTARGISVPGTTWGYTTEVAHDSAVLA